jgi:hypothetical protein
MNIGKDLAKVIVDSVEVKIDLKKIVDGVIDDVVEKALDEVVKDTANPWDDSAKATLWPLLEPKLKELAEQQAAKVEEALKKLIDDLKGKIA